MTSSSYDVVALRESHSWLRAIGLSVAISMCIAVDILQYSFPLSFLPRSLEDEGHSSRHIAAVIGGYYWSGFAGGVLLTLWQIYKIFVVRASPLTLDQVKLQLVGLIVGLLVGAATLLKQANDDSYTVHMVCRVIQGFLGAILFFYSYLLSIELFTGKQQIFALTLNTISLNVAEVGGPLLGATVFTVSGKSSSFYFLTAISVVNQVVLLLALAWIHNFSLNRSSSSEMIEEEEREIETFIPSSCRKRFRDGLERLIDVVSSPLLWKSLAVIAPSALIKAEIENILPLFADHSMGYNTMHIGYSFSAVAIAFVISSISIGLAWDNLSHRWRDLIVGSSLVFLCIFSTSILPITKFTQNETVFMLSLGVYGIFLGLTITPSSFLLGEFVDSLKDAQSKDVANGIWNTLWEMGGSVGFFISGIPRSNDWKAEELVISSSSVSLLVACVGFFLICDLIRFDRTHVPIIKAEIEEGLHSDTINTRE